MDNSDLNKAQYQMTGALMTSMNQAVPMRLDKVRDDCWMRSSDESNTGILKKEW